MAKVDWITWKTDPKELINSDKVEKVLNEKTNEINTIMDDIFTNVKVEIEKGGLNKDALSLNGDSPNNIYGNKILDKIEEIRVSMDKLKNKITSQAEEQKKCEKEQLISSIEEKIEEQEKILQNTMNLKSRIVSGNNVVDSNEVDSVIESTNEKIEMLKERLEKAKAI